MYKAIGWVLMSGLIMGGTGLARGQMFPLPRQSSGLSPAETLGIEEMKKEQTRLRKEVCPELYAFQKRLQDIQTEIRKIMEHFAKKEISKDAAKEKLLPLMNEERAIQTDPDYLVEQKLAQAYFSSPEFQAKMDKIMRKFSKKGQPGRQKQP